MTEDKTTPIPGPGPRGATRIVAEMFRLYGRNTAHMVMIAALVILPLFVAGQAALGPDFMALILGITGNAIPGVSDRALAGIAVYVALYLLGMLAVSGAIAEAGARRLVGSNISIARAYGVTVRRLPSILGASLIAAFAAGIPIGLTVTLMTVPTITSAALLVLTVAIAVYVFVRLMFVTYIALLEQTGPLAAVERSWSLVSGAWLRTFGLLLLVSIPAGIIQMALGFAGAAVPQLGALAAAVIVTPLTVIGNLLIYLDLRGRKQAYSTTTLTAELEALASSPLSSPQPPSH